MKVRAVTLNNGRYRIEFNNSRNKQTVLAERGSIDDLSGMPYVYPVSFTAIQNSSKLRQLFAYGLPCMYSGIKMIDPRELVKHIKNILSNNTASTALTILEKHKESVVGMERQVLGIIEDRAKKHPDISLHDIIKEIEPIYRKRLRKIQAPIFRELEAIFKKLPEFYRSQFEALMVETNSKLEEQPMKLEFSAKEFKYKFLKIKEFILNTPNNKARKALNTIYDVSKNFADKTKPETIEHQKAVLAKIENLLEQSVLRDNEELLDLINTSKLRLSYEEVVIPFSRKSFIYDLSKIIRPMENETLQSEILAVASKLPTSNDNLAAYILKLSAESSDKIIYRILHPTTASIEHILPRSCGGENIMSNFGGATAKMNSDRKSIDLSEWVEIHPEVVENCQKYVDRLIELYHQGVFLKLNIDPKYIVDFKTTVAKQSKGKINVDISKM
ncbi:hypothetical protein IJ579_07655 [bacterium]|nr:hypothetical protein [bacterium]